MLKKTTGFTLMEVLIAIAIMAILAGMGYPAFSTWRANAEFRDEARKIVSQLRNARSEAISQSTNKPVEIVLGPQPKTAVTLKSGPTCNDTDTLTVEFRSDGSVSTLPPRICVQDGSTSKFFVEITSLATGRVEITRP